MSYGLDKPLAHWISFAYNVASNGNLFFGGIQMIVYMNYQKRVFVLPNEALEIMGRPKYLTFLISKAKNCVVFIPLRTRRSDIGCCTIPDVVYRQNAAYAVESTPDLREQMYFLADVSGESPYAIQAQPVMLDDLKAGSVGNLYRGIRMKGMALQLDMMTAEPATVDIGRIYVTGGGMVP